MDKETEWYIGELLELAEALADHKGTSMSQLLEEAKPLITSPPMTH